MKKWFQIAAVFAALLFTVNAYAENGDNAQPANGQVAANGCPPEHACADQACNECWCLYCRYEPCYYTTKRCIEEQVPCKRKCCRYVDRYYQVQRCRYVPQYYTETCCRKEPEYYEVDECKTCKRWVCEQQCQYVPKYYWKHICGKEGCTVPCPKR